MIEFDSFDRKKIDIGQLATQGYFFDLSKDDKVIIISKICLKTINIEFEIDIAPLSWTNRLYIYTVNMFYKRNEKFRVCLKIISNSVVM